MGERVTFPSNGHTCEGYLALPPSGKGLVVVVIQEWWGLVPHIQDLVERFAREGFLALAPDLYHGKTTTSPDTAGRLLMELDAERAVNEIIEAGDTLLSRKECASKTFGVVGFCMGGALAQYAATKSPRVGAAVSFYGGFKKVSLDWEKLAAPILLFYGGKDQGVPASQAGPLRETLGRLGKNVETVVYEGAGHAFFNDARPEVHDAAASADAWKKTLDFLRTHLVGA
jgi:carboxymethylenebutenolidase